MDSTPALSQPTSLRDIFLSFTLLSLKGFGGVLAVVQQELVERKRWMSRETFLEEWTVAQTLPGPNVINLSLMIGSRYFGLAGALAALAGMLAAPLAIVLVLAALHTHFADSAMLSGALRGMTAVAAGLILASGIKLAGALGRNTLGRPIAYALAFVAFAGVAWWRLPLIWVLPVLGTFGCFLAYHRLARGSA